MEGALGGACYIRQEWLTFVVSNGSSLQSPLCLGVLRGSGERQRLPVALAESFREDTASFLARFHHGGHVSCGCRDLHEW